MYAGKCAQVPNTLLIGADVSLDQISDVDNPEECCSFCRNAPKCASWAYCPKASDSQYVPACLRCAACLTAHLGTMSLSFCSPEE